MRPKNTSAKIQLALSYAMIFLGLYLFLAVLEHSSGNNWGFTWLLHSIGIEFQANAFWIDITVGVTIVGSGWLFIIKVISWLQRLREIAKAGHFSVCYIKGAFIWLADWAKVAVLYCFGLIFWLGFNSPFFLVIGLGIIPSYFSSNDAYEFFGISLAFIVYLSLSYSFTTLMPYWKKHIPVFSPKHVWDSLDGMSKDRRASIQVCSSCGLNENHNTHNGDDCQFYYIPDLSEKIAGESPRLIIVAKAFFSFLFGYVVATEMALFYGSTLFEHNIYWAASNIYDMGPEFFTVMLASPIASGFFGSITFLALFLGPSKQDAKSVFRFFAFVFLFSSFAQAAFLYISVLYYIEEDLYKKLQEFMGVFFNFRLLNFWFSGFSPMIGVSGGFLISYLFCTWEFRRSSAYGNSGPEEYGQEAVGNGEWSSDDYRSSL